MFSYRVKVRRINSPKLKAVASLIIDEVMEIDGFKVIDGSKGLFISVPSHKGTIMEEGQKVEKYFDDVRFPGERGLEIGQEIKNAILQEFNSTTGNTSTQTEAVKAKQSSESGPSTSSDSTPPRTRKPLWGF